MYEYKLVIKYMSFLLYREVRERKQKVNLARIFQYCVENKPDYAILISNDLTTFQEILLT